MDQEKKKRKKKQRKIANVNYTIGAMCTHAPGAGAGGRQTPKPRSHAQFQCGHLSKGKDVPAG